MKRNVLFLACTHFQLMTAIQVRRTYFAEETADLILTDYAKGCAAIADRLRESGVFDRVFFLEDPSEGADRSLAVKLRSYLQAYFFPRRMLRRCVPLRDRYALFLFNTPGLLAHLIVRRYGPGMECRLFEEGYGSYTEPFLKKSRSHRILIRGFFGDLEKRLTGRYLYHPELFDREPPSAVWPIPLPDRRDRELLALYDRIFDYSPDGALLDADFIFFEEVLSGAPEGERELLEAIAGAVGKERLTVKRHPRSGAAETLPDGFRAAERPELPWELIEMNESLAGKTLLTVSSGSVLAPALYFDDPVQVYLLFRCEKGNGANTDERYLQYITRLTKEKKNYYIPADIPELIRLLNGRRDQGGISL